MSNLFFDRTENEKNFSPQPRSNILPLLRTIRRKAIAIAAITTTVTLLYSYANRNKQPIRQYAGNFQLLVEPISSQAQSADPLALASGQERASELFEVDYPSMLSLLSSSSILSDVVKQVQTEYSEFSLEQLKRNLKVERVGNNKLDASKIIAISYTEADPDLVKLVLDATAQKYLDYSLNSRQEGVEKGIEFIDRQLPRLEEKVASNQNEIQALQEQHKIVQADATGESVFTSVREIEAEQLETAKEISEQARIVENLKAKLNIGIDEAIAISTLRENPNYQNLITQLNDLERELATVSARFNPNSPQIENLESEKQQILTLLNSETRKILLDEEVSSRANRFLVLNNEDSILLSLVRDLVTAANELEKLDARQEAINRNASIYRQRAQQFPEVSRRYKKLNKELDNASRAREKLLTQKDRLQIQASQTQTPWSVINETKTPQPLSSGNSSSPLQGLFGGLALGVAAAVIWEKLQDVFYSATEVVEATNSVLLEDIPYDNSLQQRDVLQECLSFLPTFRPKDEVDENFLAAFDRLYTNIYFRFRDKPVRSIAVCSAASGDGKTTVAMGLASAIAGRGHKVMLVGANSFDNRLPENTSSVSQAGENFYISIVSQAAMNSSLQREKLMKQFAADYEYVIYDTPAMLDSVTANFLSVNTDGVLLVVALGKTKKSLLTEALKQINNFNLPLLGVVTNQNKQTTLAGYSMNTIFKNSKVSRRHRPSIESGTTKDNGKFLNGTSNYSTIELQQAQKKATLNGKKGSQANFRSTSDGEVDISVIDRQSDSTSKSSEDYDHWQN